MRHLLCLCLLPLALAGAPSQDKKPAEKKGAPPPPKIFYTMPLVVQPGVKQKLALRGKNLAAVHEVRVTGADGAAKALAGKGVRVPDNHPADRVGDSEVEIELELPKDAKPGAVKLVAVHAGGESPAHTLLLRDDLPAVAEKEDNGGFDAAQGVAVPCAIEGTIRGERDVDVYKFEGKKGDTIAFDVRAARFGSPLDGFLTVYTADRKILGSADDVAGSPDPVLTVTLPRDGTYFVSLIDAHDLGGPDFGYRLVVKKE